MVKHILMVLALNVKLGALAAVTYSWSSSLANFSVSSCPGESVGIAGAATSYLSGSDFRQTTCRNALLMEDGWKATLTYTVTVAKDMSQFNIYIVPIQQTYVVDGFSYPISYLQPSPANLEKVCQGRKGLFSTSGGAKWLSVTCRKSAFFTDQYTYSFEDSYGFSWSFSVTQSEAGLYFMVTTAGGSNQQIAYAVDTKVEWADGFSTTGPVNDNFSKASTISGKSGSVSGSNVDATSQSGEPLLSVYSTAKTTVWWKWTAPASGDVQIDTIGSSVGTSSLDTQMGIYTGSSLSSLVLVAKDDDSGGSDLTSKATFACTANTTYYICVGGYQGKTGAIKLNWALTPVAVSDFVIVNGVLTNYTGTGGAVTIPSSVTSIGNKAFYGCKGLTSVTIPSSVTRIESDAFRSCSGLTSVKIPSSVTSIGARAFQSCSGLKSVTISSSVTSIGGSVFSGCSGLTSVTIPSSVTSIGSCAFYNCSGLTSMKIPSSVTSIEERAFLGCSGLKSVTIPSSVTSIGERAFSGCSGLTAFIVDTANLAYCSVNGLLCSNDGKTLIAGVNGEVTIPSAVTSIGSYAFYNCSGLASVKIPSSVTSIGSYAFYNCSGLTMVYVGKGDAGRVKGLYSSWPSGVKFVEIVPPTIEGNEGATVTGDAETGFVIKPSVEKTVVEVTIPQGVDAAKVTVEVSPKVVSVKLNGAKVKIVSGGADITEFLNMPAADGNGVVDLTKATVKEEIVKEAMDVGRGAVIDLNAATPKLTTLNTRVGLFYQLREGETLEGMVNGDSTIGDGEPWTPEINVKGGNSAFYSIRVEKGGFPTP